MVLSIYTSATPLYGTSAIFSGIVTASSFTSTSDYRIKENVIPLDNSFVVDNLIPVTYKNIKTEKQDIGFIAHELQEQFPYLVTGIKDGEQLQTVNYIGLIGLLVKEIQDLKKETKDLNKELKNLEKELKEIKEKL